MTLPKIEYPAYDIFIHSLDRSVKFRPFLVKEEKILLIAKEGEDEKSVKDAVIQIVNNCCLELLDVENLPLFDIEMIFLKLRAKSVGENVKLSFHCKNIVEDEKECGANTDYVLNLEKVKYDIPEGHSAKIMITDKLGVKLKYPTLNSVPNNIQDEYDLMLESLINNIEYVFDEAQVYKLSEATEQEQIDFIESLNREALEKIEKFFGTSPKVILEDNVTCKKCGYEHKLHAENLLDFFI